jgi:hypothetical protein
MRAIRFLVAGLLPRDVRPRQAPACLSIPGALGNAKSPDGQEPVQNPVPGQEPMGRDKKKENVPLFSP